MSLAVASSATTGADSRLAFSKLSAVLFFSSKFSLSLYAQRLPFILNPYLNVISFNTGNIEDNMEVLVFISIEFAIMVTSIVVLFYWNNPGPIFNLFQVVAHCHC